MPKIPAWLADTMERFLGDKIFPVDVVQTRMLNDHLKSVTFKGDFSEANFVPGNEVLFRINRNEYRHYTLTEFDAERQTCKIVFYLNGKGPGNQWVLNLKRGDQLKLLVDQAKVQYKTDANQHFFFGDETSIGLYDWFGRIALNNDQEYFGILELKEENFSVLDEVKLRIDAVISDLTAPARNAIQWMENMHPKCWEMWEGATFYLTGRAKSIQSFKKYLRERGVSPKQIQSMPYWEYGRAGG